MVHGKEGDGLMLQYWRILLLLVMVVGSITAIGMKTFPDGRTGVEIVYIDKNSPAKGVLEQGMMITKLDGVDILTLEDWNEKSRGLAGNVSLHANGKDYVFEVGDNLGINVIGIERTNIDFGLDLKGGTRIILEAEGNASQELIEQTISVLETRSNLFGLQEIKFFPVQDIKGDFFIQIEAPGVGNNVVDELLSRQGKFEGKIMLPVPVGGNIQLGTELFPVKASGDAVVVNGSEIQVNETFVLKGIEFEYLNVSEGSHLFFATVFDGEDIEMVYTDPQRSGIIPQGDGYQFFFSIFISMEGASKFADVTSGIPLFFDVDSGEEYLESPLILLLDEQVVSSLRIGGSLAGEIVQSPQVSGYEPELEGATQESLRLQTILKSGALPIALTTLSVDVISPTLGAGFFDAAVFAALLAGAVVFIILFVRYRKLKVSLPLVLTGIAEVVIILGIAATNDVGIWAAVLAVGLAIVALAWVKKHEVDMSAWIGVVLIPLIGMMSWTIDLPAIAGIIAVIGTGVDHQIIIADETLRKERRQYGVRENIRRAFFIIVGASMTTIFAMAPLMFVGVGLVRGFAITTIVGVLVGILISRPAYARIIEKLT